MNKQQRKAILATSYCVLKGELDPIGKGKEFAGYSKNNKTFLEHDDVKEALNPIVPYLEEASQKALVRLNALLDDGADNAGVKDYASVIAAMNKEVRLFKGESTDRVSLLGGIENDIRSIANEDNLIEDGEE